MTRRRKAEEKNRQGVEEEGSYTEAAASGGQEGR